MKDYQKTLWFTFLLEQQGNMLLSTWLTPNSVKKTTAAQLNNLSIALLVDTNALQQHITQECDADTKQSICLHIRIMTDDAELAKQPWQQMKIPVDIGVIDVSHVVEVSPLIQGDQSGYLSLPLATPLLAIPSEQHFNIAGDRHYRIIQEYLHGYLDIYGTIPRAYSPAQLQREINFQQPDLLYIYAKYQNGKLLLDSDPNGDADVTLDRLGQWLKKAEIRPVVILSLVKGAVSSYPTTLVNNSRVLWVQQVRREARRDDLFKNMADVLQALVKTPELSQTIVQSSKQYKSVQHQLWVNGRSLRLQLDNNKTRLNRQLRAALLRVMLGRRDLKERMFSEITRSERISNRTVVNYVVSGNEMACPFDFPTQLQQRLQ